MDEDDIATISSSVRKPNGEIAHGSHRVLNPGTTVSALAEKRLKLLVYMYKHYQYQINRKLTLDLITKQNLSLIQELKDIESSHKELATVIPIKFTSEITDFVNSAEDKLALYHGCKGVLLSYLI